MKNNNNNVQTSAGDGGGFQGCWRDHSRLRNTPRRRSAVVFPHPSDGVGTGSENVAAAAAAAAISPPHLLDGHVGHAVPPALVVGPRHVALRRQTQSRGKTAWITIVILTRPIALRSSRETTFVTGTLFFFRSPSERTSRSSSVMGQKDELKPLLFNGNGDTARSEKERIARYQSLVST